MLKSAVALLLLTGTTISHRIVHNNDALQVSKTQNNEDNAERACIAQGWGVQWKGSGAVVCTKPGTTAGANCNKCDTWRLFVFSDGGTDQSPGGDSFPTVAGEYYCGHSPCTSGWNLPHGGNWQSDQPVTLKVDLKGSSLSDEDGWLAGESDPFVKITTNAGTVQTEVILDNNKNPDWRPKTITGYQLGSDIEFHIIDENSTSRDDAMGDTVLNGNELLRSLGDGKFSKQMSIKGGKGKLTVSIQMTSMAKPMQLTHDAHQQKYKFGEDIQIVGGIVAKLVKYSVAPKLPSGLHFNAGDGSVTGKCDVETHMTDYTIKACNPLGGCASSKISFECEMDPRDKDKLFNGGASYCTKDTPCQKCRGDCDDDDDCAGALVCFQRDASEPIPGCEAGGDGDTPKYDYCIDPNDIKPVVKHDDIAPVLKPEIMVGPGGLPPVVIQLVATTIQIKLRATGLFNGDSNLTSSRVDHSDPYVQVQVPGKERKETFIEFNTENPEWKYPVELTDFVTGDSISFKIFDKDFSRGDVNLGEATMDGGELAKALATHSLVIKEFDLQPQGKLTVTIEKK